MIVTVPKLSGFCYGVSRAIRFAEEALACEGKLFMFGEIVHNPGVVNKLISLGAHIVDDVDELKGYNQGSVLIRAHGLGQKVIDQITSLNMNVIDGTCPKVKKVHQLVISHGSKGRGLIVIGNPVHPEVQGILGWCPIPAKVISNVLDAEKLILDGKYSAVVQTTFNIEEFQKICEILKRKCDDIEIFNTICPATDIRQRTVKEMALESDFAIVVGGMKSSNSKKLCSIAEEHCPVVQIENCEELDPEIINGRERVLVCAGSSTPFSEVQAIVDLIVKRYGAIVEYK